MKYCKDCKWFGRRWFLLSQDHQYCHNPKVIEATSTNYVGDREVFASIAREYGPCYWNAKYWEA